MLTLLQIVQAVQGELGLPQSTSVVGNTDATTTQMFNLANRVLDDLRRDNRWTAMQFEYDLIVSTPITVTGDTTQNSAVIQNISPSTAGLDMNYAISGPGLLQDARVKTVDSSTQLTMTMESVGDNLTGGTFLFGRDTYLVPSDFDFFNNDTMWDRTNQWRLLGPDSPQIDQWHRSGIVSTGPRRHWRKLGPYASTFRLWPAPFEIASPLQLVFEYLSLNAVNVNGAGTTFAQYFTSDTDTPLLDDQAIIMGIKWMFWEIKGFNSLPMQNRYVDYVSKLAARDAGAPTLTMVRRVAPIYLSPANVQDGNWPGPGNNSPSGA